MRLARGAVVTVAVLAAFAGMAGGGWWLLHHDDAGAADTCVKVDRSPRPPLAVRVLNSTDRPGLARRTGDALSGRGFQIRAVGNQARTVTGTAQVRHPSGDDATAQLLARHVPGAVLVADPRLRGEVDLVLGAKFTRLRTPQEVAALTKRAPAPRASPSCR
jgi:hypothetical protein